jgi:hypothetical protein
MNYRQKVNRRLVRARDGTFERRNIADLGDALIPDWMTASLTPA